MNADDVIRHFGLEPHPEGGYFRETFRDTQADGQRAASTAIYFLLPQGQVSHWHRVDAAEVWHWYAGAPLALSLHDGEGPTEVHWLGTDFNRGERPQFVVPAGCWQSARSGGAWSLVGCTVAPGFEFSGFELAPRGWSPGC